MNPIDSCWRPNSNWAANRRALADCAVGFGKNAIGGKNGAIYVVTDPSDDPEKPKPGTLRYGVIQSQPLWIIFAKSMVITLKNELMMNSYKTIDGRGAKVEIAYGPCITIQHVSHVIIHGISIHDCKPGNSGMVRDSLTHIGHRRGSDGDAIDIFASTDVWIDHCYLARCTDGLIDVIHASTAITISNNFFSQHDKVTKREVKSGWKNWKWRSSRDKFFNGAYFIPSGYGSCAPGYTKAQSFPVADGSMVPALTSDAGPLSCTAYKAC
ncbi:hypothetical protein DH2020_008882 [Rehmannia glutinosa]|uniref:Pectate lyase n=1 Tax=Rehmannia glutinosa TaxID=99300 RepID=A0ABR0X7W6_REHGL